MSAINETTSHCLTEPLPQEGNVFCSLLFLKSLSYIRKLMDIAFFFVVFYSFSYHGNQVRFA